ncbi:MAG: 4-alpha-glucanotransferase, partial [Actinomycetota bacterium]|nr:4-alpha-glucanotransferase [Actinomycetota bacterium]
MASYLERRAKRWGVALGYNDFQNDRRDSSPQVVERALELMGASPGSPPPPAVRVVRKGTRTRVGKGVIEAEDGRSIPTASVLPAEVPLGYHSFTASDGQTSPLIVAPSRCYLPKGLHRWGWAIQVYALHSQTSWGIGDLNDLAHLGEWARDSGAGALMINPLHAPTPGPRPQPSPYFPGSRLFRDPLYIAVEKVASTLQHPPSIARAVTAGRRLTEKPLVDRASVHRVKMRALERIWSSIERDSAFERYRKKKGRLLEDFATYCALSEVHGSDWREWPRALLDPRGKTVREFRAEHRDRVAFHSWLQFVIENQLEEAAATTGLIADLAVGVDPHGPDAWMFQDAFAMDARVGAPPDEFNARGQDWGVLPFDPHKLAATSFQAFIETVRANLAHVSGLRLDHVMGLWRLYWVVGDDPTQGTYIRYPAQELLDIVCLESVRAGAIVVGEDLGTVEPEVRAEMTRRNMLSYRVLWFDDRPPSEYPQMALATISNHDLPTVSGLWTGRDIAIQRKLGLQPNEKAEEQVRRRARRLARVRSDAPAQKATQRLYEALGAAPSALTLGTLEDACGVVARPNYPGTTTK